jgi:putative oxidoreductase
MMPGSRIGNLKADDIALLLGRIAMVVFFLPSGISKLFHFSRFAASLAAKTLPFGIPLPFPEVLAVAAVTIEVMGPILLLLGLETRAVALWMVAFVVMANLTSHRYWELEGQLRSFNQSGFYKNIGITAGFLFLYASGAGLISLDALRRWKAANHTERAGGGTVLSVARFPKLEAGRPVH